METKLCTKCGKVKPISEFGKNKSKKDGLQSHCKECVKEYKKKHYSENKEYYLEKARTYRQKCREDLNDYKNTLKCSICGEDRWWVLDFHHLDPSEKESTVANLAHNGSIQKVKNEIEKCIVLCANCHRDEHYQQRLRNK